MSDADDFFAWVAGKEDPIPEVHLVCYGADGKPEREYKLANVTGLPRALFASRPKPRGDAALIEGLRDGTLAARYSSGGHACSWSTRFARWLADEIVALDDGRIPSPIRARLGALLGSEPGGTDEELVLGVARAVSKLNLTPGLRLRLVQAFGVDSSEAFTDAWLMEELLRLHAKRLDADALLAQRYATLVGVDLFATAAKPEEIADRVERRFAELSLR